MSSGLLPVEAAPLAPDECLDLEHADTIKGRDFLLTYRRSGTNLTISILALIGKGTRKAEGDNAEPRPFQTRVDHRLGPEDYTLFRTHWCSVIQGIDSRKNRLIFILRNFKESIPRSLAREKLRRSSRRYFKSKIRSLLKKLASLLFGYQNHHGYERGRRFMDELEKHTANLRYFDEWAEDRKLMVYYEDLLTDPVGNFRKMTEFFDLNQDRFQEVMDGFDEYSEQIRLSYHEQHIRSGGSRSEGKDLLHHSRQLPRPFLLDVDRFLEERYPELWDRYLSRYATRDVGPAGKA